MSLNIALDELRATGWTSLNSADCGYDADGRAFPRLPRVEAEFKDAGFAFDVRRIEKYNCARATWRDAAGAEAGSVVGATPEEAAVFALAQLRRSLVNAAG